MDPAVDVDEVGRRASRYWMEDGLTEITLGLQFCLFGVGFIAAEGLPAAPFVMMALMLSVPVLCGWGLKKVKARLTFPRCGYVAFPKPSKTYRAWIFVMALVGFAITEFVVRLRGSEKDWIAGFATPAFAVFFSACFLIGGLQYRDPGALWESFLTLLSAALLDWFTNLRGLRGIMVLMAIIGTFMAIIGGERLRRFLKANPRREELEA